MKAEPVPISLRDACGFVNEHHRHNLAPQGHKFSIGLSMNGQLTGVVIVGRPVARLLDDGRTAEITRCCVLSDRRNANSMLYGAAVRAARAMGYTRIVTYTLPEESGSSLKAVGFRKAGIVKGRDWNSGKRIRRTLGAERYPKGDKIRWVLER